MIAASAADPEAEGSDLGLLNIDSGSVLPGYSVDAVFAK
jgi:hypothetical protein